MAPFRSIGTAIAGFSHSFPHNYHNQNTLHGAKKCNRISCSSNTHCHAVNNNNLGRYPSPVQQRQQQAQHHHYYLSSSSSSSSSSITSLNAVPIKNAALLTSAIGGGIRSTSTDREAIFYMALLALQFGLQPILTKRFTPKEINRSTVVLTQDVVKFGMAGFVLVFSGGWASAISGWTVRTWLTVAGIPASLYCIQNLATLMAYQNLEPLTFNVLNQTKTLSAALCCYLVMGRVQSSVQVVALLLLFFSACIIEKIVPFTTKRTNSSITPPTTPNDASSSKVGYDVNDDGNNSDTTILKAQIQPETPITTTTTTTTANTQHSRGVLAVLLASFISGLAGALTQKNLQSSTSITSVGRNSYLFTMELCVASTIVMLASMLKSEDGERIRTRGFFDGWTRKTFVPIVTNAAGGIIVGLVTKYAGAVKKGFALIFGLLLSGIVQAFMAEKGGGDGVVNGDGGGSSGSGGRVTREQLVGGSLAALSLWMHSAYPPAR